MNTVLNNVINSINARALLFGAATALAIAAAATVSATADESGVASKQDAASVAVVRLEPVAVTISSERFDALRAASQSPSMATRGSNKAARRA